LCGGGCPLPKRMRGASPGVDSFLLGIIFFKYKSELGF
jgi:hypothetical protein